MEPQPADGPKATSMVVKRLSVFRLRDGLDPEKAGAEIMSPLPADQAAAVDRCLEAGIADGADTRLVFSGFGMSLVHCWFKPGYMLPRHTHDCDCVYYVIGGSLEFGTERLGPGDGFFVPADAVYAYTAGEDGVEVIEFRATQAFDLKLHTNLTFWNTALAVARERHPAWVAAQRPSQTRG